MFYTQSVAKGHIRAKQNVFIITTSKVLLDCVFKFMMGELGDQISCRNRSGRNQAGRSPASRRSIQSYILTYYRGKCCQHWAPAVVGGVGGMGGGGLRPQYPIAGIYDIILFVLDMRQNIDATTHVTLTNKVQWLVKHDVRFSSVIAPW